MARIAVVHPHFEVRGGAEMVCLSVLETIQNEHEITLVTEIAPDIRALNRHYNTSVENVSIREPPLFQKYVYPIAGLRFGLFNFALLNRYLRTIEDDFDLVICTYNELRTTCQSLLYVHHPLYDRSALGHDPRGNNVIRDSYKVFCALTAGISAESVQASTVLSNSDWTGGVVDTIYGVHPETVYPPVDTSEFDPPPAEVQENGFVSIGRISHDKNILRNITIIERLRERGHDVHLHIIGPTPRTEYLNRVNERIDGLGFVTVENELSREELVQMIHTHRYGLHGKTHEHFGIVVAEMIAGGALPFVPNSGGQREIVDERDELLYDSVEEAVDNIDRVLSDPQLEADIRRSLPDITKQFGREKFKNDIGKIINNM